MAAKYFVAHRWLFQLSLTEIAAAKTRAIVILTPGHLDFNGKCFNVRKKKSGQTKSKLPNHIPTSSKINTVPSIGVSLLSEKTMSRK